MFSIPVTMFDIIWFNAIEGNMMSFYKIEDEFEVGNSKVLVLDRPRDIGSIKELILITDMKTYSFS